MRAYLFLLLPLFSFCSISANTPTLTISPTSLTMPTVTKTEITQGVVYDDNQTSTYAISLYVKKRGPRRTWRIYVRAQNTNFMPTSSGKRTSDLMWKLNNAPVSSYTSISTSDQLIYERTDGNSDTIYIDIASSVSWGDPVETYDADLIFTLDWDDS